MRCLAPPLIAAVFSACLQLGAPGASAGDSASAGSAGSATDAGSPAATGANCAVDPVTRIALCAGISSCPSVPVDTDQYPGCGYRISGNAIDLECLCNDALCPIGPAASCADAKALLADQSALGVCARIAEGRCTPLASTTASSTPSSTCDKACRSECSGEPGCITLCGC